MGGQRYERGETLATTVRYGNGLEKRRLGTVVEVGARGVKLRFVDNNHEMWLQSGRVRRIESELGGVEATDTHEPPPVASPVVERPVLAIVPPPAPPPAPAAVTPAVPAELLRSMEAQGMDPMGMWLAMGQTIIARERETVVAAEKAVTLADAQVREAEQLLADAKRDAAKAREVAVAARARLAQVERRVAGEP